MLSAIAPRKDSAQSSKERLKQQARDCPPHTTSPLANSSTADIVTNDDRAKSPDLMRVLSPMRPRRTPKLVNAPDVKWRLPPHPHYMPSFDSLLSSTTSASETSTTRSVPTAPHDVALPVSSASSTSATLPDTASQAPLPPSASPPTLSLQAKARPNSPAQHVDSRSNAPRVFQRPPAIPQLGAHQPHFLSPVLEATSAPSLRSSILDLNVQDVGTAERRPLSDIHRQNVSVVGVGGDRGATRRVRCSAARKRGGGDKEKRCSAGVGSKEGGGDVVVRGERKGGVRGVIGRLRRSVKGAARRAVETLARKYVTGALERLL